MSVKIINLRVFLMYFSETSQVYQIFFYITSLHHQHSFSLSPFIIWPLLFFFFVLIQTFLHYIGIAEMICCNFFFLKYTKVQ